MCVWEAHFDEAPASAVLCKALVIKKKKQQQVYISRNTFMTWKFSG